MKIWLEDEQDVYYDLPVTKFFITNTDELNTMVDALRKRKGYPTFFDESDPNIDYDGWYDFYANIDLEQKKCVDFWVNVVGGRDNVVDEETEYSFINDFGADVEIDLDDIYKQISEQIDLDEVYKEAKRLKE